MKSRKEINASKMSSATNKANLNEEYRNDKVAMKHHMMISHQVIFTIHHLCHQIHQTI